jgi:hypothetical protein
MLAGDISARRSGWWRRLNQPVAACPAAVSPATETACGMAPPLASEIAAAGIAIETGLGGVAVAIAPWRRAVAELPVMSTPVWNTFLSSFTCAMNWS